MLPASSAIATDTNPATSETRAPHTTRESTSRPTLSVPSQWPAPGRASALPRFCLSGSCGASAGAPMARASGMTGPNRLAADPGIDEAIEDVDQEVAHDEADRDQEYDALHERVVAREDGVHHEAADAGQGEDVLGDDGAADQRAKLQPQHGDHRDERVAQYVAAP